MSQSQLTEHFKTQMSGAIKVGTLVNYSTYVNRLPYKTDIAFRNAIKDEEALILELNRFIDAQKDTVKMISRSAVYALLQLYSKGHLGVRLHKFTQPGRKINKKWLPFATIKKFVDKSSYVKDKLIMRLQYDTGSRISAILGIEIEDFDLKEGSVSLKEVKVESIRTVYLSEPTLEMLIKYMEDNKITKGKLFQDSYKAVYKRQKILFKRLGYEKVSSHWFRGSRAVHIIQKYAKRKLPGGIDACCKICGFSQAIALRYAQECGYETKDIMRLTKPDW